jgi:transposase InsO family protein
MHTLIEERSGQIPLQSLCKMAGVPRSSYYRAAKPPQSAVPDRDEAITCQIRSICEEMPRYGCPRVTKELRRRGYLVNHKRVFRIMRKEKLHCRRKKRFVRTTDSNHSFRVYPNLAKSLVPERPNQLWRSDITYIRLASEFVYLAIILDAFSRRVIGWALSRHIDAALTVAALTMAIERRGVEPGLIHHSDRGVQYACDEYVQLLTDHHIEISMSRKGNPYDNAMAESFMKTIKSEEVYINEYRDLVDAYSNIEQFIEIVYNKKRLHSSLGYTTPEETEANYYNQKPTLATQESVSAMG